MAVIKTIEKGESLTFGFVLPETYNLANLQAVKIYIGSSIYEHEMDGRTVRVELESNQTALITGRNIVHFVIDDSVFGIKKINCGELEVLPTQAIHKDESINTGYDVEFVLSINVETVSIGSVLYDTLKGDKGDAGTIEVGTVTTGDAGTDVIVENVGTPSEAVLNFTIPRGNAGDFFSGDYNLIINKQDAKWVDGWLWIDTGTKGSLKRIDVGYMAINTGIGTEQLKPIVHYPAALTYETSSVPNGFYLKDEDGRLSENTDFEFIDVRYNILNDTVAKYDGLTKLIGGNAAFDDFDVSHSAAMRTIFLQIYEGFTGEVYRAATDILCNNTRIDAHFEPTYARIRNVDVIGVPIVNAGVIEQIGSNADILKVAAHYGNTFERRDITPNATTFINNVIAIGSCPDEELPTIGTSYGFGVEFFEDTIKTSSEYPNFNYAAWNPIYQQSATTAIISAKFRMIKDAVPAASWDTIRKAARLTARKTVGGVYAAGFPWDMYRGFGVIDVNAAIQYIKDNYTENADYLNQLSDDVDRVHGIDPLLPYANMTANTPVPKGLMHEVTENNYTDDDKNKVTELSPIYWDEDNNTFSFPIPDGGVIQIGQEPHDYYTNLQGAQIVNGDIVSTFGATGNRTAIKLTDATNDALALSVLGMVTVDTIGNNNVGRITKSGGKVRGLNTDAYSEGDILYVDPSNPGKWTNVKPAAPLRAIQIGVVTVKHAVNGVVELMLKVYPKFTELADVDGATNEVLDGETIPVKKTDDLIKFLSWANVKATLKTYFDTLYEKLSNKQNSLLADGTGAKYPTVDAVNAMIVGELGDSETKVINQKAVTDELGKIEDAITDTVIRPAGRDTQDFSDGATSGGWNSDIDCWFDGISRKFKTLTVSSFNASYIKVAFFKVTGLTSLKVAEKNVFLTQGINNLTISQIIDNQSLLEVGQKYFIFCQNLSSCIRFYNNETNNNGYVIETSNEAVVLVRSYDFSFWITTKDSIIISSDEKKYILRQPVTGFDILSEIATKDYIFIPPGTHELTTKLNFRANQKIEGIPGKSIIRFTNNGLTICAEAINISNVTIQGVTFEHTDIDVPLTGNDVSDGVIDDFAGAIGLAGNGTHVGLHVYNCKSIHIIDCTFRNFNSYGLWLRGDGGNYYKAGMINNVSAENCYVGFHISNGAEYTSINALKANRNQIGVIMNAGNNTVVNSHIDGNRVGLLLLNAANGAHGSFGSSTFNHNSLYGVASNVVALGESFVNCQHWHGDIYVKDSKGLVFSACVFGSTDIFADGNFSGGGMWMITNSVFREGTITINHNYNGNTSNLILKNNYYFNASNSSILNN